MLEDSILKKNVPGKYSSFDLYDSERRRRGDDDDDDSSNSEIDNHSNNDDDPQETCINQSNPTTTIAAAASNTTGKGGVKGVIADYNHAKQMEKLNLQEQQILETNRIRRLMDGCTLGQNDVSISIAAMKERDEKKKLVRDDHTSDSDCSSDSDFDDDDEWMKGYRAKRLDQLQSSFTTNNATQLVQINDTSHLTQIIDETDAKYYCIVALYDPTTTTTTTNDNSSSSCSSLLLEHLYILSQTMHHCQMFQYAVEGIGLPCVMIYRNGDEVANLTPITKYWNHQKDFSVQDVENVLESFGVV